MILRAILHASVGVGSGLLYVSDLSVGIRGFETQTLEMGLHIQKRQCRSNMRLVPADVCRVLTIKPDSPFETP